MLVREHEPLAPLTTLGVGGAARFFITAESDEDVKEAVSFSQKVRLPLRVLGNGTNVLVPDGELAAVVVRISPQNIQIKRSDAAYELYADASASWNDIVDVAAREGVYGIENLAGIPGSYAGAIVQNIGAYGAELSSVFLHADCVHSVTAETKRLTNAQAEFSYRTSFFKKHPEVIILRAALSLPISGAPNLSYADVQKIAARGVPLTTPKEIAAAIRGIRAEKFPPAEEGGTAGSFFKNPIVAKEAAETLLSRFPDLPVYPQKDGRAKVSLAWLLDHALHMKGLREGKVRLYEKQPLVLVVDSGASAAEVDAFAVRVSERVQSELGIVIEREVETFRV